MYSRGDWVLRERQRRNKSEPFYDGPFLVKEAHHDGNTYILQTPGSQILENKYHGQKLFPAYVRDGQLVRSLWYGSKRLLEMDRARLAKLLHRAEGRNPESGGVRLMLRSSLMEGGVIYLPETP